MDEPSPSERSEPAQTTGSQGKEGIPESPDTLPESRPKAVLEQRRLWRIILVFLLSFAFLLGGGIGWFVIRSGLAAWHAYQDIFVTTAARQQTAEQLNPSPPALPTVPQLLRVTPTPTASSLPIWEGTERINVLLIGIDATPERAGEGALPLADALIVVSIDPVSEKAVMLSIPRDLIVEIPGIGADRINAAYAYGEANGQGGPSLLMETIEQNFGIPLDGFVQTNFEGFIRLVDLLGGLYLDVPAPIKDDEFPGPQFTYQRLYFAPGLQHFDGARALAYVRTRHDDSDLARGLRQQQVLRELREQALRVNVLGRLPEILATLGESVRTDFTLRQVLGLTRLARVLSPDRIEVLSLADLVYDATLPNGASVLIGNWPAIRERVLPLRTREAEDIR